MCYPPLCHAIHADDGPEVTRLLAVGADPNTRLDEDALLEEDRRGAYGDLVDPMIPVLVYACLRGSSEAARALLNGGADPGLTGGDGVTALMNAITVNAAVTNGSIHGSIRGRDRMPTNADECDEFCRQMNAAGHAAVGGLNSAAKSARIEMLRLLLVKGVAVDAVEPSTGFTPFHMACFFCSGGWQLECAEMLVRAGCDTSIKDSGGRTALQRPMVRVAETLGCSALDPLALSASTQAADLPPKGRFVERLGAVAEEWARAKLDTREQSEQAGESGPYSAQHLAGQLCNVAKKGDDLLAFGLLRVGADPNTLVHWETPAGQVFQLTALCQAMEGGHLGVVGVLLDGRADPNLADGDGCTPLMHAAMAGWVEIVQLLLKRGAAMDTSVHPASGGTAFYLACHYNQPECAQVLARAGCDMGLKGRFGLTGRQEAERQGHAAVLARLRAVVAEQLQAAQAAALAPSDADADEKDAFKVHSIEPAEEEKVEGANADGDIVRCGSYFYFACDLMPLGSVDMRTTYNHRR
jgi:ankyrin repeat protein